MDKVFQFKVALQNRKIINREIEILGKSSLAAFAKAITESFDFNMDHAYAFNSIRGKHYNKESYTLFKDLYPGDSDLDNDKSVETSLIHQVFTPSKQMIFYYDYGAEWKFIVECTGITDAVEGTSYPIVTKKMGKSPPQYN